MDFASKVYEFQLEIPIPLLVGIQISNIGTLYYYRSLTSSATFTTII